METQPLTDIHKLSGALVEHLKTCREFLRLEKANANSTTGDTVCTVYGRHRMALNKMLLALDLSELHLLAEAIDPIYLGRCIWQLLAQRKEEALIEEADAEFLRSIKVTMPREEE